MATINTTTTTTPTWQELTSAYRTQAAAKLPSSWLLPAEILVGLNETSEANVLSIPRSCGILTAEEIDITENYDAVTLLSHLAASKLSSVAVTTAFCKRAAIAQQLTCCLTETFFEEALERARYCDEYLAKAAKTLGPFHGLPISLKDSFNVKGIKSTVGYTSFIAHPPATENSALVQILLIQGAVLYVKTNIPQTMMTADSHNYIFGRTLNPHRLSLSAGGSSGGEGALSALHGSVLGVGTDVAGSIRIPAHCNGIIGFKPSIHRIPYSGQTSPGRPSPFGITPSAGPLCRSISDAQYFMHHILTHDPWLLDETALFIPWRTLSSSFPTSKLRLGVWKECTSFPLHPPMLRLFNTAITSLSHVGHEIVDLSKHLSEDLLVQAAKTGMQLFASDPAKTSFGNIAASGEPLIPSILTTAPPEMLAYTPSLEHVFVLGDEVKTVQRVVREMWVTLGLDALLMPVFQGTAVEHDRFGGPPYTMMANLLDYPACAIPLGHANAELDAPFIRDAKYVPAYNPSSLEGAPGGIQILGRPLHDEETLAMASIIISALASTAAS